MGPPEIAFDKYNFGFTVKTKSIYKKNTSKQHRLLTKTDVNIITNIDYLQKSMSI